MSRGRSLGAAAMAAAIVSLAAAPSALAGRVMYGVVPGAGYTVTAEGHGNGITKVTLNTCLTAGQAATLPLQLSSRGPVQGAATAAAWKIMKSDGATLAFDPATVSLPKSGDPVSATLTITATQPSSQGLFLRFKLDPANGAGLGQGPGYMVRAACVLAPAQSRAPQPPACPEGTTPAAPPAPAAPIDPGNSDPQGNAYGHGGSKAKASAKGGTPGASKSAKDDPLQPLCVPGPADAALAAPTVATFPAVESAQARVASGCVATPKTLRVFQGEQALVRVTVRTNGQDVSGSWVRVTTPDGIVAKKTNRSGVALFRVRPSKTGKLVLQSDVCFGADRVAVRAAHASGRSGVLPRFTG
jgi:hypothetical protein